MVVEQVGVILVHGIGEQRRFEHLDSQLRALIGALDCLQDQGRIEDVSVDITSSGAAAFHAQQDTWTAGPKATVTVVVHRTTNGVRQETRLQVHEVWWADVNEPYSLAKQFRFWLWGLAIWAHPAKRHSALGSADRVIPPTIALPHRIWDRVRLFFVGFIFALLGFSIGTLTFLANRLLLWQTPDVLKVIANYISAVKLFNQSWRYGPGLLWAHEDFLDSVGEPPRVSVRRRMIRAIADVACNNYHRWYILAHSQGTVVAFNGLMETNYAWPGYLDKDRWDLLCQCGMAGPAVRPPDDPGAARVMPRRPGWAAADHIAYRRRIFDRFRGLLTYGSPLEKFAGIWPALVPIARQPAFNNAVRWLNIHDPIDPVSGRLLAFQQQPTECCPRVINLGYAASWWLLLAHLKYLTHRDAQPDVAVATAMWLLTDSTAEFTRAEQTNTGWRVGTWFRHYSLQWWLRVTLARTSELAVAIILLLLGAIILPLLLQTAGALFDVTWRNVASLVGLGEPGRAVVPSALLAHAWHAVFGHAGSYWPRVARVGLAALALPFAIGAIHGAWTHLRPTHANPPPPVTPDEPVAPAALAIVAHVTPAFTMPSDEP